MLPGPARRVAREPFALGVALLACAVCVTAGLVSDRTTVRIASELDQHWRGAYDILVEARRDVSDAGRTHGLVEADFLGFGGRGGISLEQVETIRTLPGVELAAPVAMVGAVRYVAAFPVIATASLPDRLTLYRIEAKLEASDGLEPFALATTSGRLLLGPDTSPEGFAQWATDLGDLNASGHEAGVALRGLELSITSPILAVDPVAEAQLLGDGGRFLARLASIEDRPALDEGHLDATLIADRFAIDRYDLLTSTGPVIPVLVSDRIGGELWISVEVSQIGGPIEGQLPTEVSSAARLAAGEELAGPGERPIGISRLDLASIAVPYSLTAATVPWPGEQFTPDLGVMLRAIDDVNAVVAERPSYTDAESPDESVGLRIEPVAEPGPVTAYRRLRSVPLALPGGGSDPSVERRFRIAPLGTFDLATVLPPSDPLTYVPFGAYDPPQTMLFADPSGSSVPAVSMEPTTDPAGLVVPPPLVITDIPAARLLRGSNPIDAVRVRVAGVTGYDEAGRQRVEEVASRIRALGLDVTVVAGASPQQVSIFVPGYRRGGGEASDLGWVHQWWTSLGAALRVERTVARTSSSLLTLAAVAVAAGLLALGLARFDRRRRQVAVFAAAGWSRRRTAAWFGAEALLVALAAAVLGAVAGIATGASSAAAAVIAAVIVALLGAAGVEAGLLVRARVARTGRRLPLARARVRGPVSLGLRASVSRLVWTGAASVLAAVAAIAIGVAATLLVDFAPSLGASRLGAHASGITGLPEVVLAAIAIAGSLLVLAALLLAGVDARADDWRALQATGWTRRAIGVALTAELGVVLVLAMVGTVVVAPIVAPVPSLSGVTFAAAAAAAPLVVLGGAIVAVLESRRLVRTR